MPINLNKIQNTPKKKKVLTGTFFNSHLTGRGGAVGLLKTEIDKLKNIQTVPTSDDTKTLFKQKDETLAAQNLKNRYDFDLPQLFLAPYYYKGKTIVTKASDPLLDLEAIGKSKNWLNLDFTSTQTITKNPDDISIYATPRIKSLYVKEYEKGVMNIYPTTLALKLNYNNLFIHDVNDLKNPDYPIHIMPAPDISQLKYNASNPLDDVATGKYGLVIVSNHILYNPSGNTLLIDDHVLNAFNEIKISDMLIREANLINDHFTETYKALIEQFAQSSMNHNAAYWEPNWRWLILSHYTLSRKIKTLENNDFAIIYKALDDAVKNNQLEKEIVSKLTSSNLRMMLASKLEELRELKTQDKFYKPPFDQKVKDDFLKTTSYSDEQLKVITTDEPLVVAAAGAGTGKSHTLTGRLHYLNEQGQNLNQVLVLSFTNTAADNIKQRYPGIQSLTLADMFNKIYSATFPTQALTNPNTLSNTMKLLNPSSKMFANAQSKNFPELVEKFTSLLNELEPKGFKKSDLNKVTADISLLIQDNMKDVILLLNAVQQTTLALQPIIINAALSIGWPKLNMPKNLENIDVIITDESQDISTFEYIMLLDMARRREAQLMIVGDGAQTLYEFRNSNPKFLTSIQASKVFANYNLTTNYRSCGPILAYANPLLSIIEANAEAKIQLMPQDLSQLQPSEQDFKDHITIFNQSIGGKKNKDILLDSISEALNTNSNLQWIHDALTRGEKVAVIGSTNDAVQRAYDELPQMLDLKMGTKDVKPFHLQSARQKPNDMTSTLLTKIDASEIEAVSKNNTVVADAIVEMKNLFEKYWMTQITTPRNQPVMSYLPSIVGNLIEKAFADAGVLYAFNSLKKSNNAFSAQMVNALVHGETRYNDFSQLIRPKEDKTAELDASNLVFVTGHSAKGLEFDNVVVLYDETHSKSGQQDSLRMLYVTLTRAKKNELIINLIKGFANRSVGNTFLALAKTPISSLQLMSKHFATTGEYETVLRKGSKDSYDDGSNDDQTTDASDTPDTPVDDSVKD